MASVSFLGVYIYRSESSRYFCLILLGLNYCLVEGRGEEGRTLELLRRCR